MLRRPAAPTLIPVRLVIDGAESTVYLRPPNAEDLAGLPPGIKASLLPDAAVAAVVEAEPVADKGKPGALERAADSALRRFQPQIGAVLADPAKLTGLVSEAFGALTARSLAAAQDEDAAARHLLVRCVQAQDDHEGRQVPLRLVTLAADEDADPLGCFWIGRLPSLRALWPALREVIVKGTPSFRP